MILALIPGKCTFTVTVQIVIIKRDHINSHSRCEQVVIHSMIPDTVKSAEAKPYMTLVVGMLNPASTASTAHISIHVCGNDRNMTKYESSCG